MEKDERFKHIGKDPRFRRIPKFEQKVKIDKRFKGMFDDKKFKLKYTVDKRGRPANFSTSDNLRRFYDLGSGSDDSNEEEEQEEPKPDEISQPKTKSIRKRASLASPSEKNSEKTERVSKEKKPSVSGKWKVTDANESTVKEDRSTNRKSKMVGKKTQDTIPHAKASRNTEDSDESEDEAESEVEDEESEEDDVEGEQSEEDESKPAQSITDKLQDLHVDYARGEGRLLSDSSSSDNESSGEDEEEEDLVHDWGELDRDAERTENATARLAVCHMDWDRIKAIDLFVLLQSFAPPGGTVKSVRIYPSEYGLQRMQEEELHGPLELTKTTLPEDQDVDKEDSYHMERLRQYQLSRLKYYYAVVVCDSAATSARIYQECDRMEFESSAARLDLRFIPDDMSFDQEPKDVCASMPDPTQYQPRHFMTSALQQADVKLTWDETDPDRKVALDKLFTNPKKGKGTAEAVKDDDLKTFLATSSEEEESEEDEGVGTDDGTLATDEKSQINKYRSLLANLEEQDTKKKKKGDVDMEMEITWGVGLKEKAEEIVQKKLAGVDKLTPWEERLQKRKEKYRLKKLEKKKVQGDDEEEDEEGDEEEDEDIPSDIDLNDPYFKEELSNPDFKSKKPGKGKTRKSKLRDDTDEEDTDKKRAEMELLLMDDEEGNKKHFNLKNLIESDKKGKKKTAKEESVATGKDDNFEMEVKDPRFSALFTSHLYNVDPSDPNFKKTKGMERILSEKQKRRAADPIDEPASKHLKTQRELSRLVSSIKAGAKKIKKT